MTTEKKAERLPYKRNIFRRYVLTDGWRDRGASIGRCSPSGFTNEIQFHEGCTTPFRIAFGHGKRAIYCPDCFYIAKCD